jgi:hypothetical protein
MLSSAIRGEQQSCRSLACLNHASGPGNALSGACQEKLAGLLRLPQGDPGRSGRKSIFEKVMSLIRPRDDAHSLLYRSHAVDP